ncbi:Chitin-binding protein OS=Streptomyces tendae OX=1932 GN=F3L20_17570 PE=4 SV=1 [Streptomyces tendae]
MQWVRSDSQENFFSCSDVVFDGGNGEVTGIRAFRQHAEPGAHADPDWT